MSSKQRKPIETREGSSGSKRITTTKHKCHTCGHHKAFKKKKGYECTKCRKVNQK